MEKLSAKARGILFLGILPIFVALAIYAVTWAFVWDEGFHLIAAQLISEGKRPYIDFCFPQTPLNACINALVILLFGSHWQPIHLLAVAYISASAWLVADLVQSRLESVEWRTPCAIAAATLFGLNAMVVQFGPSGQAYAIGMFLGICGYRAALPAVKGQRLWFALLSGILASGAAASTLLTAPAAMVLFIWILFCNQAGSRWTKALAFIAGCFVPFAPVIWLYIKAPKQTLFNVLQYQTLYRRTNWGDANMHDLDALTDWLNSPPALILIVFFVAAVIHLWYAERSTAWREFLLAAALGVALVLFISTAHPTFERYFCVAVPYLGITCGVGLYGMGSRLTGLSHAWKIGGTVVALCWLMFARSMFDQREDEHWSTYEEVAQRVQQLNPIGTDMYAEELVYFLLALDPPEGQEFSYAQKLELSPELEKLYHVHSNQDLIDEMEAGKLKVFETCRTTVIDDFEPASNYQHHIEPKDCDVFWGVKAKQ